MQTQLGNRTLRVGTGYYTPNRAEGRGWKGPQTIRPRDATQADRGTRSSAACRRNNSVHAHILDHLPIVVVRVDHSLDDQG